MGLEKQFVVPLPNWNATNKHILPNYVLVYGAPLDQRALVGGILWAAGGHDGLIRAIVLPPHQLFPHELIVFFTNRILPTNSIKGANAARFSRRARPVPPPYNTSNASVTYLLTGFRVFLCPRSATISRSPGRSTRVNAVNVCPCEKGGLTKLNRSLCSTLGRTM